MGIPDSEAGARQARYWLSHSIGSDLENATTASSAVSISISLEAGLWKAFRGVRLLIVCEDGLFGDDLLECVEYHRHMRPTRPDEGRKRAMVRRNPHTSSIKARSDTLISGIPVYEEGEESKRLPFCTIILEIFRHHNPSMHWYLCGLRWMHARLDSTRRRILYDQSWLCSATIHAFSVYLDFECERQYIFRSNPKDRGHHHLQVLPIGEQRPRTAFLSPELIKQVIFHSVNPARDDDWRQNILDYALVQKSWLPALDVFYELSGSVNDPDRAGNPMLIAQAISIRPERGRLISRISDQGCCIWSRNQDVNVEQLLRAYRTIIDSSVLALKHLTVGRALLPTITDLLPALHNLRVFETLVFRRPSEFLWLDRDWVLRAQEQAAPMYVDKPKMTLKSFRNIYRSWSSIKEVNLHGSAFKEWKKENDSVQALTSLDEQVLASNTSTVIHTLEQFEFTSGYMDRADLFEFASSALTKLTLRHVSGASNADLQDFLETVSPTLASITIEDCGFAKSPGEPHAVEAALPKLKRVDTLELIREMGLSKQIFLGRIPDDNSPRGSQSFKFGDYYLPFPSKDLPAVMEATHWTSISLLDCRFSAQVYMQALAVAERRGIMFV